MASRVLLPVTEVDRTFASEEAAYSQRGRRRTTSASSVDTVRHSARAGSPNRTCVIYATSNDRSIPLWNTHAAPATGKSSPPPSVMGKIEDENQSGESVTVVDVVATKDVPNARALYFADTRSSRCHKTDPTNHDPDSFPSLTDATNATGTIDSFSAAAADRRSGSDTTSPLCIKHLPKPNDTAPYSIFWDDAREHYVWRGEITVQTPANRSHHQRYPLLSTTEIRCRSIEARNTRPFCADYGIGGHGGINVIRSWVAVDLKGKEKKDGNDFKYTFIFELPIPLTRVADAEVLRLVVAANVEVDDDMNEGNPFIRFEGGLRFDVTHLQRDRWML